jgi:hypothetical protein
MGKRMSLRPLLTVLALLLLVTGASAQDSRSLELGVPLVGEVNAELPAQVYTFDANSGDLINLGITSQPGLALTFVVTDSAGNQLATATDNSGTGGVQLTNIALAQGTNYVVVFIAAGSTERGGQYRLVAASSSGEAAATTDPAATLEPLATTDPAATPEPTADTSAQATPDAALTPTPETAPELVNDGFQLGQVLTTSGLQVTLDWESTADLNLELRDPEGQRLFFDTRTNENGGSFGFDVNGLCEVLNSPAQETAEYSAGAIPVGSYEILVYYRQNCENNGAQPFTVNITVDGVALPPVTGTLQPPTGDAATVYITSFMVNPDGTATAGASGPYIDTRVIPQPLAGTITTDAKTPLTESIPLRGFINGPLYYDLYSFSGVANQVLALSMTRVSGNLDTLLVVLDPNGQVIADNDDIVAGNVTDSAINNPPLRLPADGVYTVLATRYGKDVGGTAGEYEILLLPQESALPQEVIDLGLPTGDIQITLVWNTNADLQLLVRDPSGQSVYDDRLTVPSGGRMTAQGNLNCVASLTTPVSHIYWPPGLGRGGDYEIEVWYQNQCNDTRAVNAQLYITVAGQQTVLPITPQFNDRFVTSFRIEPDGQATLNDGGYLGGNEIPDFSAELPTAPVITANQVVQGNIDATNDFDIYVFDGTAGQIVDIRMERATGSLDTSLFLIDVTGGFQVAQNDDAVVGDTTDSLIDNFALPTTGRYVILATHFGGVFGGTSGAYRLSLTTQQAVASPPTAAATPAP